MLKLACILDNPGAPPTRTQYRDPAVLRGLGYTGVVIYHTTGLCGVDRPEAVGDPELQQWVREHIDSIRRDIESASAAGLDVFICYDAFVLAQNLIKRHANDLCCVGRPTSICPASDAALARSVDALASLLGQLPPVAGVVLRFGDTDAARLPFLRGNDLYKPNCPRCAELSPADRIGKTVRAFQKLVVNDLDKTLIVRAWNVRPGGLHDTPELAARVADQLAGDLHDRTILSFKFTESDFLRYQRWNRASQQWGGRPILYELECQREYEAKGGIPNWQAPIWRDGAPETAEIDEGRAGLKAMAESINLAGVLAWVRGGGWGGPFVESEHWIDANVFAAPKLADDLSVDPLALAQQWVRERLGLSDFAAIDCIANMLQRSVHIIQHGCYLGPSARKQHATNGKTYHHWIEDDLIDVQVIAERIGQLPDSELDEVVREKSIAVENLAADRALLRRAAGDKRTIDPLYNTLQYAESLFATLRDLLGGLVAWRRYQATHEADHAAQCQRLLLAAQNHWTHHTQRCAALPGCATAFREKHFWETTQDILAILTDAEVIA